MNGIAGSSPQRWARFGGALYVTIIAAGIAGELLVRDALVVAGDATATIANIRAHEWLWRFGIAINLFHLACSVALSAILYVLLRPAGREVALMAVLLNVAAVTLESVAKLFLLPALFVLGDMPYASVFTPEQLHALAYLSIRLHTHGFNISLIFFGVECVLLGWLILRSQFLPKAIGALMQVAGACYLVNGFALLLAPGAASMVLLVPCFVAESSLALWLLVRGVDPQRWRAIAQRAAAPPSAA